jgi:voltage-gated potassium channel
MKLPSATYLMLQRRRTTVVAFLVSVIAGGTAGYVLIERWPLLDALYMTMITIGSVGFMEVHDLSPIGRVFTMVLIVFGLAAVGYAVSTVTAFIVEGELTDIIGRRRMERRIAELREHIVVCGAGETAKHIARELVQTRTPFVVVEVDPDRIHGLQRVADVLYVIGDATESEVLREARVPAARGLITAMPSDKDNLFVILTARELNPAIRIVSRVIAEESRTRMLKAGADSVVSNNLIGGLRMASEMLRPHVVSFLDAMLRHAGTVRVQEVQIPSGPVVGRSLGDLRIQERIGVAVFSMRAAANGAYHFNPSPTTRLAEGDVLIACADADQLERFRELVTRG